MTQGERLITALRRRPMTYLEMMQASGSLSPQKRCMEALRWFPGLAIAKGKRMVGKRMLVTWRVVRA